MIAVLLLATSQGLQKHGMLARDTPSYKTLHLWYLNKKLLLPTNA